MNGCSCCKVDKTQKNVAMVAAYLRDMGFHLSSVYRCKAWNQIVGGLPKSKHLEGKAIDVTLVDPYSEKRLWSQIPVIKPDIIIFYPWGVHLDWRRGCTFRYIDMGGSE